MTNIQLIAECKKAVMPYVQRISIRREAMEKADAELWQYAMSLSFDKAKHREHDAAIAAVKKLNIQLIAAGEKPVYTGDIANRQDVGRFCCILCGDEASARYVD